MGLTALSARARALRPLFAHPLFGLGIALRLLLIVAFLPAATAAWYGPFMAHSVAHWSTDPWAAFLADGGSERAFPYGYLMWLLLLPMTWLTNAVALPASIAYGLTLLLFDLGMLLVLRNLIVVSERVLLVLYWCSPIMVFATYWLGLNDIVPITLICLALVAFRSLRMSRAGALCGLAVSTKASMFLPVPFMLLYLVRNPGSREFLPGFLGGLASTLAILLAFYLHSPAAVQMLVGNPEISKIYDIALPLGTGAQIYLMPLAVLMLMYVAWRVRRMSYELLLSFVGLVFFVVLLLTPAAPGWFVWVLPFLVFYQVQNGRRAVFLASGFAVFYILVTLPSSPPPTVFGSPILTGAWAGMKTLVGARGKALLETGLFAFGLMLSMRIWKNSIASNDYFRMSRKPLVIGIAGDSGAGKDSLVDALENLFGNKAVARLSGDDYHFWDRHKPMWQVMTHLHPRANDLSQFAHDLMALIDKRAIFQRHYDHAVGRRGKPLRVQANDVIVASGLHALYLPILRECYDVSIYLDIDEGLRRHFKIERDVHQRGHPMQKVLEAMDRRTPDACRFIHPQADEADLVLSLQPIHPRLISEPGVHPIRLKLGARFRPGLLDEDLARTLIGVCGLHVEHTLSADKARVSIVIEGECCAEDIALAARQLIPRLDELIDLRPHWQDGVTGLMQLITIAQVHEALRRRLI